jgi:hypothetical protein
MSNEVVIASSSLETAGLSQLERVVDTFIAPSKTFADILRNTSWWLPFLLTLIFSIATAYTVDKQVGYDRIYQNTMQKMPSFVQDAMAKMTPEQRAAAMQKGEAQTKYGSYGTPVILLVVFAIYALMIWGSFNFGLGAQLSYGQVLAVTWYAALPFLLRSVLSILTLAFGNNSESFDPKNPVGTNLAYYLPDAAGWLKGAIMSFDLIALWSLVLMVVGMAIISKKSKMQSAIVVGIFFLLGVLIQTASGAFSG